MRDELCTLLIKFKLTSKRSLEEKCESLTVKKYHTDKFSLDEFLERVCYYEVRKLGALYNFLLSFPYSEEMKDRLVYLLSIKISNQLTMSSYIFKYSSSESAVMHLKFLNAVFKKYKFNKREIYDVLKFLDRHDNNLGHHLFFRKEYRTCLKLMSTRETVYDILYVEPSAQELKYQVVVPSKVRSKVRNKVIIKGSIPFKELPEEFPNNWKDISDLEPYLKNILAATLRRGHTRHTWESFPCIFHFFSFISALVSQKMASREDILGFLYLRNRAGFYSFKLFLQRQIQLKNQLRSSYECREVLNQLRPLNIELRSINDFFINLTKSDLTRAMRLNSMRESRKKEYNWFIFTQDSDSLARMVRDETNVFIEAYRFYENEELNGFFTDDWFANFLYKNVVSFFINSLPKPDYLFGINLLGNLIIYFDKQGKLTECSLLVDYLVAICPNQHHEIFFDIGYYFYNNVMVETRPENKDKYICFSIKILTKIKDKMPKSQKRTYQNVLALELRLPFGVNIPVKYADNTGCYYRLFKARGAYKSKRFLDEVDALRFDKENLGSFPIM